tara:strand:+ start:2543 stop:2812 length:270 start_codon:yes stop_codon:yes gene_type:complete
MKGKTMTIRKHILSYLTQIKDSIGQPTFRTSDIQGLSFKGESKFGRMLGSPSTYEREFRRMRQEEIIMVTEGSKLPNQKQATWILKEII